MLIIKKAVLILLVIIMLFAGAVPAAAYSGNSISAEKYILVHESGEVLYGKNQDRRSLIASTTKLMTGILALENCSCSEKVKILPEYCAVEGSSMYLKAGEEYTVRQLLEGLLLVSGNDAAKALACHCAGTEAEFVKLMNKKARELKMSGSHFENPHGLDGKEHYSTARDLSKLMLYCMENPEFREISSMPSVVQGDSRLINHNRLLKLCKGCKGGKTGYTRAAGRCLVSCCERDGMRLVCVTLSAPDDWNDHIKLYRRAFSEYKFINAAENAEYKIPLISAGKNEITIKAEDFEVLLSVNAKLSFRAQLPFFCFAPVSAGERAGKLEIYADGRLLGKTGLYYAESVQAAA